MGKKYKVTKLHTLCFHIETVEGKYHVYSKILALNFFGNVELRLGQQVRAGL